MSLDRKFNVIENPMLLLVETDTHMRRSAARMLQQRGFRIAIARNISEALEMIDDLRFIESGVDGLLVQYHLPDGLGCRIVQEFQREFPDVPTALVVEEDDITMRLWTRARGTALMQKTTLWNQLEPWLESVKVPA